MRVSVFGLMAAALWFGAATAGAQATGQEPPRPPAAQEQAPGPIAIMGGDTSFDPNQPIRPGFQISVDVSSAAGHEKDLSGAFVVDPTGAIQMTLPGRVDLRGLTPAQAADKIAADLGPYIKEPKVAVSIVSVPKPVVFLSGGVSRAGATPVNDQTTLAELLTIIGFSDDADLSHVRVIHRDEKGARTVKEYNFLRWLKPMPGQAPDESQNPVLEDRDYVFVPLKTLPGTGNVVVEGDVLRPGVVPLRVGVPTTLREIVSMAGGPNPTADRRQVSVRRLGVERAIAIDYDKMEAGDPTQNIEVLPDDIVYVQRLAVDQYVNLNGAFVRPGRLPYNQPVTLTQVISDAGGLLPNAKEGQARVFRHVKGADPTATQIIAFNYKKVRNNQQPDMMILPGDTVEIPMGNPPRPPMDPLQLTTSLLSIALLVDRLFGGGSGYYR